VEESPDDLETDLMIGGVIGKLAEVAGFHFLGTDEYLLSA